MFSQVFITLTLNNFSTIQYYFIGVRSSSRFLIGGIIGGSFALVVATFSITLVLLILRKHFKKKGFDISYYVIAHIITLFCIPSACVTSSHSDKGVFRGQSEAVYEEPDHVQHTSRKVQDIELDECPAYGIAELHTS